MQSSGAAIKRHNLLVRNGLRGLAALGLAACATSVTEKTLAGDVSTNTSSVTSDPVLNLMLEKGMITEDEASKVQSQVDSMRTNPVAILPPSKWNISRGIKNIELFGDLRLRYEDRQETAAGGGMIDLQRFRYAVRVGFRGEALDDFDYGFRLDTSANPRSSWVTLGSSAGGIPYQGPFGKSNGGVNVAEIYLGWHPYSWFDFTVGAMPNPLYTTPMVWTPALNPTGLAEKFKYTVGQADFFATFGQFIYQDQNPVDASGGLGFNGLDGQFSKNIYQLAWSGGVNYHITTNLSVKMGATIYQYYDLTRSSAAGGVPPFYGDPYVGEGAFIGPGTVNGFSGYGTSGTIPGFESLGYPNNQVGLDNLLVLEVPFEINYRFKRFDTRLFGDFAYNFQGRQRAEAAAQGYAAFLAGAGAPPGFTAFSPQTSQNTAYQIGFAIGSEDALGLVNGTTSKKHAWEVRSYWQHTEQYAVDPNLVDQDFFAGALNMEGIYVAAAFSPSDNTIITARYGHASRIDDKLGTGGTGQDIPQINPIKNYDLFQADLTFRF
jgi:hypothetical protein